MKPNLGLMWTILAPFSFTVVNIGLRLLSGEITAWGLVFLRGLFGFVALGLFAIFFKKKLWEKQIALLASIGFCGSMGSICTAISIGSIPLYQALVILYLYPVLALLLSALINKESFSLRETFLVLVALGGGLVLIWPNEAIGLYLSFAHLVAFLGSLLYSLNITLARRLAPTTSPLAPMFFFSPWGLLATLPLGFFIFGEGSGLDNIKEFFQGLAVGAMGVLSHILTYSALKFLPAFKVGTIGYLEVFLAALASWLIFYDPMTGRTLLGGLMIIISSYFIRKKPAS